tara:strand:- start:1658 stop:1834 length:177 start_codon:yes stop_codon:yes gene_type:complete
MDKIIEKYYLKPDSKLVNHQIRTKGVDCWFHAPLKEARGNIEQHRCLDFEDFKIIERT